MDDETGALPYGAMLVLRGNMAEAHNTMKQFKRVALGLSM